MFDIIDARCNHEGHLACFGYFRVIFIITTFILKVLHIIFSFIEGLCVLLCFFKIDFVYCVTFRSVFHCLYNETCRSMLLSQPVKQ